MVYRGFVYRWSWCTWGRFIAVAAPGFEGCFFLVGACDVWVGGDAFRRGRLYGDAFTGTPLRGGNGGGLASLAQHNAQKLHIFCRVFVLRRLIELSGELKTIFHRRWEFDVHNG